MSLKSYIRLLDLIRDITDNGPQNYRVFSKGYSTMYPEY